MELALSDQHQAALEYTIPLLAGEIVADADTLILGGGTVLAMHWRHRYSTDLDFVVVSNSPPEQTRVRPYLETLEHQGKIRRWRSHRGRSILLESNLVYCVTNSRRFSAQ